MRSAPTRQRPIPERASPSPLDFSWSVVPHTHWDREWYMPFDHMRIRLARTVDEIVEVMETCPAFRRFTLDGQAVILDDYAELRSPERVARLRALARDGRIAVGPMYTLPDEFLVGAESLVRNFLMGRHVTRRHGLKPMAVGYLPDTFGHVAQLPQVLRGFGLDTFIFWRGLDDRVDEVGTAFAWEAPDGSRVAAIRQLGGYGNACQLGAWGRGGADHREDPAWWPIGAADRFDRFLELHSAELRRGPLTRLLLCNGSDHEPIWGPLPELLDHAREAHAGLDVSIDSYEEYVEAVRPELADLPVVRGELVGGRDPPVLRGINSTRIWLKQENERTERALGVAETLASLALLRADARYPLDELRVAWRELLKNQPHDSVSGCSVDEVQRDMRQRYVTAQAIAERVRREALAALSGEQERWSHRPAVSAHLSVVNPLPQPRRALVEIPLPSELKTPERLHLATVAGPIPIQLDGPRGRRRARAAIDLPVFGALSGTIVPGTAAALPDAAPARVVDERTIENGHLTVRVEADATVTVTRADGSVHRGLLVFEDVADRGDEYNFDALPGERPWRSAGEPASVRVRARGPVVAELEIGVVPRLPRRLAASRDARSARLARVPITTTIRLVSGIDRLECTTVVDNTARDHRLRVVFPAVGAEEPVRAEGHFAVLHRPARSAWRGFGWLEPPAPTAHAGGAVAAGEVAVFTKGLPEYEAIKTADGFDLAVTLLRCVGWLSRDDLVSRPGHAGPALETPEAQCLGRQVFEYALAFGCLTDLELVNASADFRYSFEIGPVGVSTGALLEVAGEVVFSALKGAEDGDGAILRVFNPSAVPTPVLLGAERLVQRLRLDEAVSEDGGDCVQPGQIATYRLR